MQYILLWKHNAITKPLVHRDHMLFLILKTIPTDEVQNAFSNTH